MSTIAAIATPDAVGGISVIRISGDKSIEIADKIFEGSKKPSQMDGYTCCYGYVNDENNKHIDDVVVTVFKAPKSYTGENVIEISCHGGRYITKKILREVLKNGAEPAMAGEFTKRAFLNGKLSLTQAEAVMDVISSSGESQLRYANALKDGAVFRRINNIKNQLVEILGNLAAWADFPEEDVPEVDPLVLGAQIDRVVNDITKTIKTYDDGRIIREGINTVICGKPNVGKSTLMNCLSGYQRSIVTDIAGTTRDVIEESVKLGDLTLRLSDTAGIRSTDDVIESMGVDIAYKKIEEADLILAVFDCTSQLDRKEKDLINKIYNKNTIAIINKIDEEMKIEKDYIEEKFKYVIELSAKNDEGTEKLVSVLKELFINNKSEADDGNIANERQKMCLEKAYQNVQEALEALNNGAMLDAVTVCLDTAAENLMELTGEKASETVINDVFSRFCVGK